MEEAHRRIKAIRQRVTHGNLEAVEREHRKGKLTARERIDKLLDRDSFIELEPFSQPIPTGFDIDNKMLEGDGVVTGFGCIEGRQVCVWAQDATVLGGRMGIIHARKICRILEYALSWRVPCIGIYDSEGIEIENFLTTPSNFGYDRIAYLQTQASGVIPQISLIMGPCLGAAAISAQLTDFVFMVKNTSYACVSAPKGQEQEYGDAWTLAKKTACCDVIAENDEECISKVRELLLLLPQNNGQKPPKKETTDSAERMVDELASLIPGEASKAFNMYAVISLISDNGYFFEIKRYWANNLIVGFALLDGNPLGILANNPRVMAGAMSFRAAEKMARFVQFCDAFNIPILWLADTPAFLTTIEEEQGGIIRRGDKCVYWNSNFTVPGITIYLRKCYAGANLAMIGRNLAGDLGIALPTAEVFSVWPETGVSMIYGREIEAAPDPDAEKARRTKEFKEQMTSKPWQWMGPQDFIDPREIRVKLIKMLKTLQDKTLPPIPKKHDNITL